jgi:hypothetical protein
MAMSCHVVDYSLDKGCQALEVKKDLIVCPSGLGLGRNLTPKKISSSTAGRVPSLCVHLVYSSLGLHCIAVVRMVGLEGHEIYQCQMEAVKAQEQNS